jgi:hypothetical protein
MSKGLNPARFPSLKVRVLCHRAKRTTKLRLVSALSKCFLRLTKGLKMLLTFSAAELAWCIYRDGEDCTNPDIAVHEGECAPVCRGNRKCHSRMLQ